MTVAPQTPRIRFAYADPPYPGQAKRHYGEHEDYAGEVDHRALVDRLDSDFDGWALSTNAKSLQAVLALCPPVRVLIWHKPRSPHYPGVVSFMWEPVILRGGRAPKRGAAQVQDFLSASPESRQHKDGNDGYVIGAKPPVFCRWLFECAGLEADDELHDLFPGSGGVTREWQRWRNAPRLRVDHPLDLPRNARRERDKTHPQLDIGR